MGAPCSMTCDVLSGEGMPTKAYSIPLSSVSGTPLTCVLSPGYASPASASQPSTLTVLCAYNCCHLKSVVLRCQGLTAAPVGPGSVPRVGSGMGGGGCASAQLKRTPAHLVPAEWLHVALCLEASRCASAAR